MTREPDGHSVRPLRGSIGQPYRPVPPDDLTQARAGACTAGPAGQRHGTVLRDDSPTDPVWPLNDPSSTTQQAGIPARHFGALAGRVTIASDFDAPLDLTDVREAGWLVMKLAHVRFDPVRSLLVGTIEDGVTVESADPRELAERMFAHGARHGHVCMADWREGDTAPASGHRIAFHARLNQLGRNA